MSKKIIAVILCLVMVLSLCGCSSQVTYTFDGVSTGPTSVANVENNGSNIVFADGYAYYVSASRSAYATNVFGETVYGAIMRENLSTGEIVTIQSKLVADQNSVGIFISGDKIYYTSPSDTTDRDGDLQVSYLDVMVCDLNGANPEKLYTFGYAAVVSFVEENGVVYAVFEDEYQLKAIDLSASKPSSTVIAEDYYSGVSSSYGVYIVRSEGWYQDVYKLSMTGEETLVISGKTSDSEKHDVSILAIRDNKIYYTMNDSVVKQNTVTYVCDIDGSNAEAITSLTTTSAIYPYADGYIFQVDANIYYKNGNEFVILDETTAGNFKIEGDYLFTCTFDSGIAELYKTDISAIIAGEEAEAELMFEESGDTLYETTIGSLTFYDGIGYYYSNNSSYKEFYAFDVEGYTSWSMIG